MSRWVTMNAESWDSTGEKSPINNEILTKNCPEWLEFSKKKLMKFSTQINPL